MRHMKQLSIYILLLSFLALSGCGGSNTGSNSTVNDQFASNNTNSNPGTGTGTGTTPTTPQDPTFNLALSTDLVRPTDLTKLPQIDANSGTVLLTAQCLSIQGGVLIDPNAPGGDVKVDPGAPAPGKTITYKILAGPGTITYPQYTKSDGTIVFESVTDNNGKAQAVYTAGNVLSTTNVIIEASTTIGANTYRAYTTFQIVRGSGVIMFSDAANITPGQQSNIIPLESVEVNPSLCSAWIFLPLMPFKVTDSNANPRVGVPVTLSVYSITTMNPNDVAIDFLVPPVTEATQKTITSDSAGQGVFNVAVTLKVPPPGIVNTVSIVFKAVTNDSPPVTAYVGRSFTVTSKLPTLTITPSSASFGTATEISFRIAGGLPPYTVSSNNTARVTTRLSTDGLTVFADLVDTTAWTGAVTISVVDSAGQTATATVSR